MFDGPGKHSTMGTLVGKRASKRTFPVANGATGWTWRIVESFGPHCQEGVLGYMLVNEEGKVIVTEDGYFFLDLFENLRVVDVLGRTCERILLDDWKNGVVGLLNVGEVFRPGDDHFTRFEQKDDCRDLYIAVNEAGKQLGVVRRLTIAVSVSLSYN